MSKLIMKIDVPSGVRTVKQMCPNVVEIFDDHVACQGGQGGSWFFKDFTGVSIQKANIFCAFASVVFLNSVSGQYNIKNGAAVLQDRNRILFASGMFSYENANTFTTDLAGEIESAIELYKSKPAESATTIISQSSAADELVKFKGLLDAGVITQLEFDAKKKQILGL